MVSRIKDDREDACYICGIEGHMDVHHIFEGSKRRKCDEYRLVAHLCRSCHEHVHSSKGEEYRNALHELAQKVYEMEIGSREDFIDEFILSYM